MSTIKEERANRLLNDPLFKETLDTFEEELKSTWYHSGIRETEAREHCWLSLRLLERIRTQITSIVETGEIARKLKEYHI